MNEDCFFNENKESSEIVSKDIKILHVFFSDFDFQIAGILLFSIRKTELEIISSLMEDESMKKKFNSQETVYVAGERKLKNFIRNLISKDMISREILYISCEDTFFSHCSSCKEFFVNRRLEKFSVYIDETCTVGFEHLLCIKCIEKFIQTFEIKKIQKDEVEKNIANAAYSRKRIEENKKKMAELSLETKA